MRAVRSRMGLPLALLGLCAAAAVLLLPAASAEAGSRLRTGSAAQAASGAPQRLLVDKDAAWTRHAPELLGHGIRVLEDYGGFVLAEADGKPARALLRSAGIRVRRELGRGVRMRRRVLTPVDGTVPARQGGLHVLGFPGPVRPAWLRALREVPGIRVLGAAPENGYVVWLPPDSETSLAHLPMAPEVLAPLDAADRLSPDLDFAADPLEVAIFFVATPRGRAALSAAGDLSRTPPARAPEMAGLEGAVLTLSRVDLEAIAGWDEMVWAEPWGKPHLDDEVSDLITAGAVSAGIPLGPGYRQWLASHGLDDLSAYTVDVVDTGIDAGPGGAEHGALSGRVVFSRNETLETGADDCVGHGTHIAGIIAGDPPAGDDLFDANGYEYGLGVAPTARLGSSRIFTCAGNLATSRSFTDILTQAWDEGARISNNSWGIGGSAYSSVAAEYDAIVRDVDRDPSDGEQPMVVVVSSGNSGPADYTISNPAVAKNVIAVGGSESVRPEAADGCGTGPEGADNADELRTTSGRGPTTDGRLKPDLVAPGSHIVSTVSQSRSYTGLGLCNTFYPPDQRLYTWTSGTSQSAAHVSGASVLVMEDYRRQFGRTPSPAMIKAALVATARDLGRSDNIFTQPIAARPSNAQGWGRVDLSRIIGERFREAFDQEKVFASSGEEQQLGPFIVADPNRPVSVVLAWTDAPGMPAASAWVNDLDLQVTTATETYLGNVFSKGYSVTGGNPDGKNNLEAVILRPGTTERFSVTVSAVSLAGDGVPSEPGVTDQDFALYLDNVIHARAAGRLFLDSADYTCNGPAKVIVTDHGLAGGGRIHVVASSTTETAGELLDLDEDPPGTGIFRGEIPLAPGSPGSDGVVQVADGDLFTVSYRDADVGDSTPATVSASAEIHCSPLEISQVRVDSIGTTGAGITWKTNRPADSTVTSGGEVLYRDPSQVTDHRAVLRGLDTCASYPFEIASADHLGETASAPPSGSLAFSTSSGQKIPLFDDDLESTLVGWTHSGAGDDWEIGRPQIGPPGAASGTRVWGTNLDGAYDPNEDSYLQMPPVDLKGLRDAELRFKQFLDIPLAGVTGGPQDGGWVEASMDGGKTWVVLSPKAGYPVSSPGNPWLTPISGVYAGASTGWSAVRMDLSSLGGGTVRIRFRFRADPSSPGPPGAGWFIDDVSVGADFPCGTGTLAIDSQEYGCRSSVKITLADEDVDRNPLAPGFASAVAEGPEGPVAVQLRETTANSGIFTGRFALSPVHEPGALVVPEGESFTVRYEDRQNGAGSPATVETSATVVDCTAPPPPSAPSVAPADGGRLRLQWDDPSASDLAEVRIYYDADAPGPPYNGTGAAEGDSPVRVEPGRGTALLSGLASCTPYYISLTAVDRFGNESTPSPEAIGIPFTGTPCQRATVDLSAASGAGCSQEVPVRVDDANASANPSQPGTISVTATSGTDPAPLVLTLPETGPGTGTYTGTIPLSPVQAGGSLHVAEGDRLVVTYDDQDVGGGAAAPIVATLPIDDCTPPGISGFHFAGLSFDSVRMEFTTSEPATSIVQYGLDAGLSDSATNTSLATSHALTLTGLPACSNVFYRVLASDDRGNTSILDDGGSPLHFGSARELEEFHDDMESGAPGWTSGGPHSEWELGVPTVGPPPHATGATVWGTDLDGRYDQGADATLTTPEINLVGLESAYLTFSHWYDIYTSTPGAGFDDGGWVEISRNGGATWTYVAPDGGYPDRLASSPYLVFGTPGYAGKTTDWEPARFNLDAFAGSKIRIRFHLYQDNFDPPHPGLGWYIDDVAVYSAAPCHAGRVHLAAGAGNCGDSPMTILVWDSDADVDPQSPDTVHVRLASTSDPAGLDVPLGETGPSTGEFSGEAPFASPGGGGVLSVNDGDVATATYEDLDDGTGSPATRTSSVTIGDCTAPDISSVSLRRITNSALEVRWQTNEPATSRVDVSPSGASFSSAGLTTGHSVIVSGLQACGTSAVTIRSTDAAGNVAVDAGAGGGYDVEPAREVTIFSEDFETGAPGWEHYGDPDEWEVGVPQSGPGSAFSGTSVAATDLDGTYDKDPYRERRKMLLVSPPLSLAGLPSATLTVNHWYRFAPGTQGDGGVVEVLSGGQWHPVAPLGGYPGVIRTNRSNGTEPAFVDFSNGWVQSSFNLSPWAGGPIRIRFRLVVDQGTPDREDGWYLDAISVTAPAPCHRGVLQLDREGYGCGPGEARVLLSDADLDQSPASVDTASVIASEGGAPVSVGLTETGPATGVFTGSVPFSPSGGAATLRATQGGTFQVIYDDADDGSGLPATATADGSFADCTPPVLSAVSSELPGGGNDLRLRWTTDEPSTTEAVLTVNGSTRTYASADLSRQHAAFFPGLPDCTAYSAAIASSDATGNRSSLSGTSPPFEGESRKYTYLLRDDMEGVVPGWTTAAAGAGWQRGVPVVGPPGAFSGTQVTGTNLTGLYTAGTDDTLRTPVIDLTAVPSATFSFWHFYDIFAKGTPNAEDDGGWIEVIDTADSVAHHVVPDDGYSNTVDRDGSPPIKGGSGVFAGKSEAYLRSTLDLTPWLGKRIWLQFHIWNDVVEGPFNRATGAGWYIDDVAVTAPGACFQPPAITSVTAPPLAQGASGVGVSISGSGLRSPLLLDAGSGLAFHDLTQGQGGLFTGKVDVSPTAATGRRDLIVGNPDGQSATLPDALEVIIGAGRADIDGSGVVDGGDLARLAAAFGSFRGETAYDEEADLDGDGVVDGLDLALLASSFGQVIGP